MANPLPEEKELFERIKNEKISLNPEIWDMLYNRIGDDVSGINLLCQYYLTSNQPIPFEEGKKILNCTRHIKEIVNQLTVTSKSSDFPFPELLDSIPLHPVLQDMFTHYIGNDVHMINLVTGSYIDFSYPQDIPLEDIQRILNHTRTIKEFMDRLREATSQEANVPPPQEETDNKVPESNIMKKNLTKEEIFLKIRKCLIQEFEKLLPEEEIKLESRFIEDLGLDSLDSIQVVMVLEEEFGFEIPDEDVERIFTILEAVDYIFNRLKKGA